MDFQGMHAKGAWHGNARLRDVTLSTIRLAEIDETFDEHIKREIWVDVAKRIGLPVWFLRLDDFLALNMNDREVTQEAYPYHPLLKLCPLGMPEDAFEKVRRLFLLRLARRARDKTPLGETYKIINKIEEYLQKTLQGQTISDTKWFQLSERAEASQSELAQYIINAEYCARSGAWWSVARWVCEATRCSGEVHGDLQEIVHC